VYIYTLDILRDMNDLSFIRSEWDSLWRRSNATYYLSFASCLQSWQSIHEPLERHLACIVLREKSRLQAILPMVIYRRGLWRIGRTVGPNAAEGCDILAEPHAATALGIAALNRFLQDMRPDFIDLPFVRTGSLLDRAIANLPKLRVLEATPDQSPLALLQNETDWASYRAGLSRNYQKQIRGQARRFGELGKVEFETVIGKADHAIDWLLREKRKWAEKVNKRGPWIFSPLYQQYLRTFAAASPDLLTFILKLDGAPVAVKLAAINPTSCSLLIAAYDERYYKYSPGSLLDQLWMEYVFTHHRTVQGRPLDVDFGAGREIYKMHWSRGNAVPTRSYKLATSPWGSLPWRMTEAVDSLKQFKYAHRHEPARVPVDA